MIAVKKIKKCLGNFWGYAIINSIIFINFHYITEAFKNKICCFGREKRTKPIKVAVSRLREESIDFFFQVLIKVRCLCDRQRKISFISKKISENWTFFYLIFILSKWSREKFPLLSFFMSPFVCASLDHENNSNFVCPSHGRMTYNFIELVCMSCVGMASNENEFRSCYVIDSLDSINKQFYSFLSLGKNAFWKLQVKSIRRKVRNSPGKSLWNITCPWTSDCCCSCCF